MCPTRQIRPDKSLRNVQAFSFPHAYPPNSQERLYDMHEAPNHLPVPYVVVCGLKIQAGRLSGRERYVHHVGVLRPGTHAPEQWTLTP